MIWLFQEQFTGLSLQTDKSENKKKVIMMRGEAVMLKVFACQKKETQLWL